MAPLEIQSIALTEEVSEPLQPIGVAEVPHRDIHRRRRLQTTNHELKIETKPSR
jgi:hypothetical protein